MSTNENYEFIPKGEESAELKKEQAKNRSTGNDVADDFLDQFTQQLDAAEKNVSESVDIENDVADVMPRSVNFDDLESNYNSIIEQSTHLGKEISNRITVGDLGKESAQMLTDASKSIIKRASERSFTERLIAHIPSGTIRNKLSDMADVAETEALRNKTVRDFAQSHFDALDKKRQQVNESRCAVSDISMKLKESNTLLLGMYKDAKAGLQYVLENDGDLRDEIKGKELVVKIGSQLTSQQKILESSELFEKMASVVSDRIQNTLPSIKSQFIDQVSITISLESLNEFKKAVDNTTDMVLDMQSQSMDKMLTIVKECKESGLGATKAQQAKKAEIKKKLQNLQELNGKMEEEYNYSLSDEIKRLDADVQGSARDALESKTIKM